jgi:hypothetical protein
MPQQCPRCMSQVHAEVSTYPACGAIREVWGQKLESGRQATHRIKRS